MEVEKKIRGALPQKQTNKLIEEEIRFAVPRSGVGRVATKGTNFQLQNESGLGIQRTTWLT